MKLDKKLLLICIFSTLPIALTEIAVLWQTDQIKQFSDSTLSAESELLAATEARAKIGTRLLVTFDVLVNPQQKDALKKIDDARVAVNKILGGNGKSAKNLLRTGSHSADTLNSIYRNLALNLDKIREYLIGRNYEAAKRLLIQTKTTDFYGTFVPEVRKLIKQLKQESTLRSQILEEKINFLTRLTLTLSLSGIFAIALFSYLMISSIVKRIKQVEKATYSVGYGELDFHLSETGNDELTQLSRAFNKMTVDLGKANTKLLEQQKILGNHSKMASLGEMSAGIAHEVNNPLAIIMGHTDQLLKYANQPEKLNTKIEAIKKSCERISKIINGLRKFSRSGNRTNLGHFSLQKIIEEALILTELNSKKHDTPITCEIKTDPFIHCDELEIEQVLVNLIHNAIDAVKERPERWVKVLVFEENLSIVMQIMDSGPGIPEIIRSKLFDPFFTTKRVGEGTGLGLSIVKGIIDEHHATIEVLAHLANTCFEIRFKKEPVAKSPA